MLIRSVSALMTLGSIAAANPFPASYSLTTRQDNEGCNDNSTRYTSTSAGSVCLYRPSDCTATTLVESGDTCNSIADRFNNFTLSVFRYWNPDIGQTCFGLRAYTPVCIGTPWYTFTPPVQSPDGTIVGTTDLNPTQLPVPVMPSIVEECNRYFLAGSGQRVDAIAPAAGVSVEDILSWNPTLDKENPVTWAGYWLCVGVSA
ncbi:hypothetical protein EJ05DRAFT_478036 [Pseudovirgaria hyperparasitica]|uniref:LysM domain-containing protein n=1 Tax=Pseudovirgaria hyperparasitica TaxID=470096 RepID=A0A6A6VZ90_9PEZI|nr:uncharacterized protein EJ05DRAFT_478036 [Pseudovirgaria hyperparasitica]KAF2755988.1 hypothetical protein EJ05DRAFT_478036 [Pseudovirgaria hyperparasitica]